jgi:CO dehydrogenase maturation factor
MEAGVEHLGRATVRGVDAMIIVVEPGIRAIECAKRIISMSADIGLTRIKIVANKVTNADDERFICDAFPSHELIGMIPYSTQIGAADRRGESVLNVLDSGLQKMFSDILEKAAV